MPTVNLGRFAKPTTFSVLLIAVLAFYYGLLLPQGAFSQGDEYLTLDRTYSFTLRDDWWSVYSENRPTFKKPPLQYWMGALLLEAGVDLELALRLPSFVFAVGVLLLTGWLARMMLPTNPWVFPAAMLLMASSKRFWENAMSALLDNGATFFVMVALVATYAAVRQPRWWYIVALACGLGAMQKAPIPVLFSAAAIFGMAVTRPWHRLPLGQSMRSAHFLAAVIIGLVLTLAWPALQWLIYGQASFQEAYLDQIVERFSPFGEDRGKQPSIYSLLIAGEPLLRIPAIVAMFWLPWRLNRMEFVGLPAVYAAYALAALGSSGIVSPRYSLIFMPMLMASLAAVLLTVIPGWRRRAAFVAVLCMVNLGPLKTPSSLDLMHDGQAATAALMERIGASIGPDETLLVCRRGEGGQRIFPGAISYYASAGKPFYRIRSPEHLVRLQEKGSIRPPYRVLCGKSHFEEFGGIMTDVNVIETENGFMHWTAGEVRTGQ